MKRPALSQKFILSFLGTLLAVFLLCTVLFECVYRVYVERFIRNNIFEIQNTLDKSVTETVNESVYLYSRLVQGENTPLLQTVANEDAPFAERKDAFDSLIASAGCNERYFTDVVLVLPDTLWSKNGNVGLSDREYEALRSAPNTMQYVANTAQSVIVGICARETASDFCGIFLFYMQEENFADICNPSDWIQGYSFLMRKSGLVVSHAEKELVNKTVLYNDIFSFTDSAEYVTTRLDGKKCIVITQSAQSLNFKYGFDCCFVSVLDYDAYFGTMRNMTAILIAVTAAVLIAVSVVAVYFARRITTPIQKLGNSISATAAPTKTPLAVLEDGDEIQQLEKNFDAMMNRIYDLVEKNKKDSDLARRLELESLQMQINPHFLYNTLDAISWMAKIKKQPEIERLVMNLARFFRLSLHKGDKIITVAEEVELVQRYLEIDNVRFPDRVQAHFAIEEGIGVYKTLKLILQPLVENCLKYAFPEGNGSIFIRAYSDGQDIVMEVEDDGIGFTVTDDILTLKREKDGGYGLVNVHQRIRLQYGEGYGLTVQSEPGHGTTVFARIRKELA